MPLPSYVPRSDSFSNWYFGGFQVDSTVESGYGAGTALNQTQAEFNTFLDAALGVGSWVNNGSNYYFRFNNPYEQLTGSVTTTANYRFALTNVSSGHILNTSPTGSPITVGVGPNGSNFILNFLSSSNCAYAVANQYGMWLSWQEKASPGTLGTTANSSYIGWAKDPVFPTNTVDRVRNLIIGQGTNSGTASFRATRGVSTTTLSANCVTNSVITCQTSTPGANITDLCFLDSNTSYLNIGSAYNALFYPGTGLTVGQIYRIPPAQDPDGNTEQNIWLCAGQVQGWNGTAQVANAGYKLIRVWSNNIT